MVTSTRMIAIGIERSGQISIQRVVTGPDDGLAVGSLREKWNQDDSLVHVLSNWMEGGDIY